MMLDDDAGLMMCVCVSVSVGLWSVCLSVCMSVCLSVCLCMIISWSGGGLSVCRYVGLSVSC